MKMMKKISLWLLLLSLASFYMVDAGPGNREQNRKGFIGYRSNSESEEWYTGRRPCSQYPGGRCPDVFNLFNSLPVSSSGPAPLYVPANPVIHGLSGLPGGVVSSTFFHGGVPHSPAYSVPTLGSSAFVRPASFGDTGGKVDVLGLFPGGAAWPGLSQGFIGPAGSRPSILQDIAQGLGFSVVGAGFERPGTGLLADVDLCSDSPINGMTALINGTIVIFKGELFWLVDPVSHTVSRPQSILTTLGVPSPIDTVFTRCNCHGNIYIIKGDSCWRLDGNMVMEPGYPRPLASEFSGLTGSISAALATPATRSRPETVYFFKKGDILQRFVFPSGSSQSCRLTGSSFQKRVARQADALLSPEINLTESLKGFPTPVTSALSIPRRLRGYGYEYYVFSGHLYFNVQILGNLPVLAKPDPFAVFSPFSFLSPAVLTASSTLNANLIHPINSIRVWLGCR